MNTNGQLGKSLLIKGDRDGKPKICIISLTNLMVDGRTQRQIKTLRQTGCDVSVIFHQKEPQNRGDIANDVHLIGIHVRARFLPKWFVSYLIMYVEFCLKTIYFAYREKADVYQATNLSSLLIAYMVGFMRRALLVYDSREIYIDMQGVKAKSVWKMLEGILVKRVDAIIDVNQERAELKRQRYALADLPAVVMNCPEACSRESLNGKALHSRLANLGFSHKKAVIYQGAIMRGRYLENLVRAMEYVRSDVMLILMGPDVGYRDELKNLVSHLGVGKRVLFLDSIPPGEIVSFVSGADIGILFYEKTNLNNYYCAPTKLYEYLMAGLPILVNDLPHLRTMVMEEGVGKVLSEMTPQYISQGINDILESKAERTAMSRHAREIACERYNWATQSKIYAQIIRELVNASLYLRDA